MNLDKDYREVVCQYHLFVGIVDDELNGKIT